MGMMKFVGCLLVWVMALLPVGAEVEHFALRAKHVQKDHGKYAYEIREVDGGLLIELRLGEVRGSLDTRQVELVPKESLADPIKTGMKADGSELKLQFRYGDPFGGGENGEFFVYFHVEKGFSVERNVDGQTKIQGVEADKKDDAAQAELLEAMLEKYYLPAYRYALGKDKWDLRREGNKIVVEAKFEVSWNRSVSPVVLNGEVKTHKLKYRAELEFLPEMSDAAYRELVLEHVQKEIKAYREMRFNPKGSKGLSSKRHAEIDANPLPKYWSMGRTPVVLRTNAKFYMGFVDDEHYREVLFMLEELGTGMSPFLP
ncbi:hypothetical protein SAMN02745181_0420 [Rubritalea squalenifaciens DSM 18772]|uniref:Uncharacterized protein n=2 Tax=Rubritalea squalenifaciens TaxID=407226 RepID=A0A1M6C8V7_9BACT|nr:hypothetical protein SAMN02745181_0420 [Rubritalea squalenifaciens DSM 18772]